MSDYSWKKTGSNTPCKDCENRHEGCHSDCAAYLSYKATREAKKEAFNKWSYETRKDRMDRLGRPSRRKRRQK